MFDIPVPDTTTVSTRATFTGFSQSTLLLISNSYNHAQRFNIAQFFHSLVSVKPGLNNPFRKDVEKLGEYLSPWF